MTNLTDLGVAAIRDGVRAGDFSAREVAEAHVAAIEKGRSLNAFTVETPERARAMIQSTVMIRGMAAVMT